MPSPRLVVSSLALLALTAVAPFARAADRPNIIVILVDDMGFSDLGCYGSEIPTPNIDKMASEGLRFTQFYNTGRCCPTRAALLTGLYSHQTGIGHMTEDKGAPGYIGHLNDSCVTFGQVMKPAGYFTAMTGKWHVGQEAGVTPWGRGFERNLNSPAGGFYYPQDKKAKLFLNGKSVPLTGGELPNQWYTTDLYTDFGIKFINEGIAQKKPFFLYLAYNAPHFPLQAPADEIAKFRGKYKIGWDKLRDQRYAKQIQLGLIDKQWALSPRAEVVKAWDQESPADQDRFDNIMAIYAACVAHIDTAVGHLMASLKEKGVLDNTLIFLMSDNGANAESGPMGKLEGKPPGGPNSTVFEGQSWATLSNTPFRWYKHYNHEGGIATPLIVHWPAKIPGKNEFRTQPGHLVDIMATCVDVSGAKYPTEMGGKPILPMEGRSLVPAFTNQPIQRDAIYWEHEGNAAVREGDMKLVRVGLEGKWELYDLKKDRTELHDLAKEQPDKAKALLSKWTVWATRCNVLDKGGEGKKGKGGKGKGGPAGAPEE